MRFNPFEEKPMPLDQLFMDWDKLYPKPYHLGTVHPYTKVRIVLMNGTEFEAQWFGHQFSRHCQDNDLRRELAMIRRIEQMQQKRISCLKPKNETVLEHTITYEQLAVWPDAKMTAMSKQPWILPCWKILTICTAMPTCWIMNMVPALKNWWVAIPR